MAGRRRQGHQSKCLDRRRICRPPLLPVGRETSLAFHPPHTCISRLSIDLNQSSIPESKTKIQCPSHEIHLRLHCILSSPISEHSTVPPRTRGTESLDRKVDKNETRVKTVFVFNPFHLQVCLQGNRSRDQRASQPDLSLSHLIFGFL